jgi:Xaa-Pro dipeptidase
MDLGSTGDGTFSRLGGQLKEIQAALREQKLDGWLMYDLHARNSVAGRLLELGDLTRRYFVLVPAEGEPVAVTHGIEQQPWWKWPWRKEKYVAWKELDQVLKRVLAGHARVAMEISERDAVPAMDLVPYGVVGLVREAGAEVVTSGELVTRFSARWSPADLISHRRTSIALAQVANAALMRLAKAVAAGESPTEGDLKTWVLADLAVHGCASGAECIPAAGVNAANPHYEPAGAGATFRKGDVVLLDLWAKESHESVFSDQTWMGYLGAEVPAKVATMFAAIRDGRDAAVEFLQNAFRAGRTVQGYEVDDVTRGLITQRGYGAFFIHRTGHSIDQATHGMGPNIDNLETRETRRLMPGVAFSIEPGLYIPGDVGMRTEIDVYIGEDGPEVTTPGPQKEIFALLPS